MIDMKAAAERLNANNRAVDEATKARKLEAQAEGRRLAHLLGESDPLVRRVWGFGSVFELGRPFNLDSDIDLAVEGGDFFALLRLVEVSPFPVDLVDISGQEDPFAALVRTQGVTLFLRD